MQGGTGWKITNVTEEAGFKRGKRFDAQTVDVFLEHVTDCLVVARIGKKQSG